MFFYLLILSFFFSFFFWKWKVTFPRYHEPVERSGHGTGNSILHRVNEWHCFMIFFFGGSFLFCFFIMSFASSTSMVFFFLFGDEGHVVDCVFKFEECRITVGYTCGEFGGMAYILWGVCASNWMNGQFKVEWIFYCTLTFCPEVMDKVILLSCHPCCTVWYRHCSW